MLEKIIRLGIIGTGHSAKLHLDVFRSIPGVKIVAITGKRQDKAYAISKEADIPWCPASAEEMIYSSEIDALVIAVPPLIQPDLALLAFENRKHVLCEKPIGINLIEANRVTDAWKTSGCVGLINFCYRMIPQIQEFKSRITAGECGHVHSIHAEWILSTRLNPSLTYHWKGQKELGGGVLQNFGIHVIDYLFYDVSDIKVLGAKQNNFVTCRLDHEGYEHPITGDEIATAIFDMAGTTVVIMHLSLVTIPALGHRVIARGSQGTLEVRNLDPKFPGGPFSLWFYKENLEKGKCLSIGDQNERTDMFSLFSRVANRFVKAIRGNKVDDAPTIDNGLKASEILHKIESISRFL